MSSNSSFLTKQADRSLLPSVFEALVNNLENILIFNAVITHNAKKKNSKPSLIASLTSATGTLTNLQLVMRCLLGDGQTKWGKSRPKERLTTREGAYKTRY